MTAHGLCAWEGRVARIHRGTLQIQLVGGVVEPVVTCEVASQDLAHEARAGDEAQRDLVEGGLRGEITLNSVSQNHTERKPLHTWPWLARWTADWP